MYFYLRSNFQFPMLTRHSRFSYGGGHHGVLPSWSLLTACFFSVHRCRTKGKPASYPTLSYADEKHLGWSPSMRIISFWLFSSSGSSRSARFLLFVYVLWGHSHKYHRGSRCPYEIENAGDWVKKEACIWPLWPRFWPRAAYMPLSEFRGY